MDFSSDEEDYDFYSSDDETKLPVPVKRTKSENDIMEEILKRDFERDSTNYYQLVKRDSVYQLMNSVLDDLAQVTGVSQVSHFLSRLPGTVTFFVEV